MSVFQYIFQKYDSYSKEVVHACVWVDVYNLENALSQHVYKTYFMWKQCVQWQIAMYSFSSKSSRQTGQVCKRSSKLMLLHVLPLHKNTYFSN